MKAFKYLSIAFTLILCIIALGTLVPAPVAKDHASVAAQPSRRILILDNPIHTDIALPVDAELLERFAFLREASLAIEEPGVRYLIFGWGGRAFYTQTPTWADLKPLPVLKSLTLDRSVMHIALAGEISPTEPHVAALDLSENGYRDMLDFILGSFAEVEGKRIPLIGQSYGQYDVFFEANGYFNVLLGCNTWTAAALRQAGLRTGWWTPLPPLLSASLWLHNDAAPSLTRTQR
ncbi:MULTISPECIES: TIGR02117 family protein [unclassified Rhizobium]|uniref:TIGR02117 family protein n=1 Tax=unclassified Rhizobium TaxID=2613769 RepID=UPI00177AB0D8|nr:TIGR02117 family protein [Rhizobium sp. CFBP 13644]MBD8691405.1 TIGR02117 family protein [Rhizobium sp. CFBP 13717]